MHFYVVSGSSTISLLSCCVGLARSVHKRFELPGSLFTNQYIEMSTVFEHCISVTRRYRSVHTGIMRIYIYCTKRSQMPKKISRLFSRSFEVCSRFLQDKNVYEPNFATFWWFPLLIFCSMCLTIFIFVCFIFWGGAIPHKKGGYIPDYTQMIFCNIETFKTTWKWFNNPSRHFMVGCERLHN